MAKENENAYSPADVEEKWQRIWDEQGTNSFTREELLGDADPFYNLMMFPYPSAEGLHIVCTHSGVTLGPEIARLIADSVQHGCVPREIAQFGLERFQM